eukprot:CAMPEP_0206410422 /NCGR_PEP_ID=MMETSP0294-20121207/32578_1 /ASSEMBLY_ACC=CAM_ASM_000327 /TAXON_ID=39354 /ORGANISM="Heterosigma akashiwo, Strain CCMP2393" /LENGTH=39 /DNA_ID= /DNA_START= /DNA_END= /DNA_ORIENTATION=
MTPTNWFWEQPETQHQGQHFPDIADKAASKSTKLFSHST